jgi:phenylalanyl-tRNA synthetase beta chain
MKFSLSWLNQHLESTASLTQICDKLTALGLEVEGIEDRGKKLAPFIVAEIQEATKHPDADRLRVCKVNTGTELLQVVCGAPNARAGIKVVLARPGDVMPNSGEALKKGAIRGVESQGMMCALDELGIGGDHAGIIEVGADAQIGSSYAKYAGYDDAVIEINLTPNRPDCAGVLGIARDLAASGIGKLKPLDTTPIPGTEPSRRTVSLDFPHGNEACPLFIGRTVRNIRNGPSPAWLQQRLTSIGLRPISALVDITNYLTFDCARPLHVFDANKLSGNLRVHPAQGGESFDALNGKIYTLENGMTVISDDSGILSLAGIMGGLRTSCDEGTTDVFIESAYFDPVLTALTGRTLQITSDARYRFERGIDPLFTEPGAELATKLIIELCGTPDTIVSTLEIAGGIFSPERPIELDPKKCLKHTGVDVPEAEQERILTLLGFNVKHKHNRLHVTSPSWRPDIEGTADLIEEIIRVKGYDALPITSLPRPDAITNSAIDAQDMRQHNARRALAGQGLMEAVTWSFMPSTIADAFGGVTDDMRLSNPISSDLDVMRPTILGNLIQAAKRNADRGFTDVSLFEIGPVFKNQTPGGQTIVATTLRAGQTPRHWATPLRAVDTFDAKADALAALGAAGAPTTSLQITTDAPAWYHPGRSGVVRLGPTVLAIFGEIHPTVLSACDAAGPIVASEIFLANIPAPRSTTTAKPMLKLETLQPVSRDFAFVVDRNVQAAKLIKAIKDADKSLIRDVNLFDVYEGDKMANDKKSIAVSVTLQPIDKSLTDAEIDAVAGKITDSVTKATGATLRS